MIDNLIMALKNANLPQSDFVKLMVRKNFRQEVILCQ